MLTAAIAGLAASWLFGFSVLEGLLVGSIVSATDGAAIFGLLRDSSLRPRIARTLEGEAGVNDPIAVLLVVGLIDWIELPDYGLGDMVLLFLQELGIGLAVGIAVGWIAVQGLRRASLGGESGYAIGTIGAAAVAFGAGSLHGSGFLAVYLAGLFLGTVPIPAKPRGDPLSPGSRSGQPGDDVRRPRPARLPIAARRRRVRGDAAGARSDARRATGGDLPGDAAVRVHVSRAIRSGLGGAPRRDPGRPRHLSGDRGVRRGLDFFNIVFFAVLLSTLLQGATFEPFAKALGVTSDPKPAPTAARLPRPPSPAPRSSPSGPGLTATATRAFRGRYWGSR